MSKFILQQFKKAFNNFQKSTFGKSWDCLSIRHTIFQAWNENRRTWADSESLINKTTK